MNSLARRACLYGSAAVAIASIGLVWVSRPKDADLMTLLSSVDTQLRLAHGIPARDAQGKLLSARTDMITAAEKYLVEIERMRPGIACAAEFRGFAHMLKEQYVQAADWYERAQRCRDCTEEQRDVLAFNQARMLAKAGRGQQALGVFAQHGKRLDSRFGTQRFLEEAAILRTLGRADEARQKLAAVVAEPSTSPVARMLAGIEYGALGDHATAVQLLASVSEDVPIAAYHLAQLKLQQGDVDSSLDLLGRAAKAQPAEVRRKLRDEATAWSAVAADVRFQEITKSGPAAPAR